MSASFDYDENTMPMLWKPHRPDRPAKSEGGKLFKLVSDYEPAGDQLTAIPELVEGVNAREHDQVLLGVTGSGKTFTMAKIIELTQRPALILAPNKTLAAQLYSEFKSFFPHNAVEYFVSYYDYYQPEAYVPRTDTYIEKDSSINEQIDRMRHSATRAILERDDVIVVASVSCIYGIGSVETYTAMTFTLEPGQKLDERKLMGDLVAQQYKRNDQAFERGTFRRRGDTIQIFPARYLTGRRQGEPPPTFFEYIPENALLFVDESHQTVPQIGGMYRGDYRRKFTLAEYGFRLPSAMDNRPLKFEEWDAMRPDTVHVSATPGPWEMERTGGGLTEHGIRPTGP